MFPLATLLLPLPAFFLDTQPLIPPSLSPRSDIIIPLLDRHFPSFIKRLLPLSPNDTSPNRSAQHPCPDLLAQQKEKAD